MKRSSINRILFLLLLLLPTSLFAGQPCSRTGSGLHGQGGFQSTPDPRTDSFEVTHYSIDLDLQDFQNRILYGSAVVSIQSKINGLDAVSLDLMRLTVDSIKAGGQSLAFGYDDTLISIDLAQAINQGDSVDIEVFYHGTPFQNPADWGGFYWTSQYAFNIGVSFVEDPHNFGRVWFPCLDNFTDRATYTFEITTDSTRKAFCGGLLTNDWSNPDGSKTWRWELNQEVPTYLASVAVSDYTSLEWMHQGLERSFPVILAARAGDTNALKGSFIHLDSAIEAYERMYLPFQFDRLGYAIVPFSAGAMEHVMNIAYMRMAVNGNTTFEHLMAHELSHHWWGDLVTCETASQMWLNEGWASYSEFLFDEFIYGYNTYLENIKVNHDEMLQFAHFRDGDYLPVSGVSHDNTYSTTVYNKGADVIHTLRSYMGDSLFFYCLSDFLDRNKFSDISSEQLRDELSACSGVDLDHFFDDWIFQGGWANFNIDKMESRQLIGGDHEVNVFIRQRLNNADHLYEAVPVELTFFSANMDSITKRASVGGACSQVGVVLPFEPVFVAFDFYDKLSDATSSQWHKVSMTGLQDFGTAKMLLDVDAVQDTALIRVEHHWVAPDPFKTPMPGISLSQTRYWKVDGVFSTTFQASGEIRFDETSSSGFLDQGLISNTEDSLVLLYRQSVLDDWTPVPGYQIDVQVNPNNKRGLISWPQVQRGEYCLGIYDAGRNDTVQSANPCLSTFIEDVQIDDQVKIFPNPTEGFLTVQLNTELRMSNACIFSMSGKELGVWDIAPGNSELNVELPNQPSGTYFLVLEDELGKRISKPFIIK